MSAQPPIPHGPAIYLAVVQFFFVSTWTVYVIFLPALLETAGIPKSYVIWVLMLDQAIFAIMDLALGRAADRVGRTLGRIGPAILAVTAVSCIAFLLLPHAFRLPKDGPVSGATVAMVLVVIWVATSSALRAPPWVLLSRYAATPAMPWLAALNLTGLAIGGAIAPYLGVVLKGVDPALPFAVASIALIVTTAGLIRVERVLAARGDAADTPMAPRKAHALDAPLALFFGAMAIAALGFQVHAFINAGPQYLRFAKPADLPWLIPVFWVGFNLAMFPGAGLAKRHGALPVIAVAAGAGCIGLLMAGLGTSLEWVIAGQLLAGGAWGAISMASFSAVSRFGHTGHEGFMTGLLWSALSIATLLRMASVAAGLPGTAAGVIGWAPTLLWAIAAVLVVLAWRRLPEAPPAAAGQG